MGLSRLCSASKLANSALRAIESLFNHVGWIRSSRNKPPESCVNKRAMNSHCGLHGLGPESPLITTGRGRACQGGTNMEDLKKTGAADRSKINMHEAWRSRSLDQGVWCIEE